MRSSLPLLIVTAWALTPIARAQTASSQSATTQQTTSKQATIQPTAAQQTAAPPAAAEQSATGTATGQPAVAFRSEPGAAHASRPSPARHSSSRRSTGAARASAAAGKADGVVDLGATDITGNKELPKVMVIVPWKDSLGASGVMRPTDSLLDEVLQPVDRGVFQRQIRYFGQLGAAAQPPASGRVAPVGDSH